MPWRSDLARIITGMTWLLIGMGVFVPVLLFLALHYIHDASRLQLESEFTARQASRLVSLNPSMWQFEGVRLENYLIDRSGDDVPETRRILQPSGEVVAEHKEPLKWPLLMRSTPLLDSGRTVGRVEVYSSFRPFLVQGSVLFIASLTAGALVLGLLTRTPLRSLADAEQELRRSEEVNRKLIESANDGIIIFDAATRRVIEANRRATELLGAPREEIIGKGPSDLYPLDKAESSEQACFPGSQHQDTTSRCETHLRRKDGTLLPVEVSTSIMEVRGQQIIQNIYRDITERVVAMQEIEEAGMRMQSILERSPVGVFMVNTFWAIEFANPAAMSITGIAHDRFIGQFLSEFPLFVALGIKELLLAALEGVPFSLGPVEFHRPDGQRAFGRFVGIPFSDRGRDKVLVFLEDFTELKVAEEERQRLNSLLLQSRKMESLGTLVSGIAHDFNNILLATIGLSDVAMEKLPEDHPARQDLEEAVEAAERGAELIRSLMAFSRHQDLQVRSVPLEGLVQGSSKLMSHVLPHVIDLRVVHEGPSPVVNADPVQIEQVLINLMSNAGDAMPQGGSLTIRVLTTTITAQQPERKDIPPGDYAVIEVTDTGSGIPPEVKDRIFDPFFTTKASHGGTGLGLATAYGIVSQHGGMIDVTSEPGSGTVFSVYLPLAGVAPHTER